MGPAWILAHLARRPAATLAAVSVLAVVGLLVGGAVAWQQGLDRVARSGADPAIVYLLARGSEDAAERSLIEAAAEAGARAALGRATVAAELLHMGPVATSRGQGRVTWRGIEAKTRLVRPAAAVAEGRWAETADEVVVGHLAARELGLTAGDRVALLGHNLRVAGILDSALGFAGGEIWIARERLAAITGRDHASLLAVRDGGQAVAFLVLTRPDLGLVDVAETAYLARLADRLAPLRLVAWLLAGLLILAAGAGAVAAAVARAESRRRELAVARSLGVGPLRLSAWLGGEVVVSVVAAIALVTALLLLLDGTVIRIGTVAPALAADGPVFLAAAVAVVTAAVIQGLPSLAGAFWSDLARQLRRN